MERKAWPWAAWASAGLALEVYALRAEKTPPLTRVLHQVQGQWWGRLLLWAAGGAAAQHFLLELLVPQLVPQEARDQITPSD